MTLDTNILIPLDFYFTLDTNILIPLDFRSLSTNSPPGGREKSYPLYGDAVTAVATGELPPPPPPGGT